MEAIAITKEQAKALWKQKEHDARYATWNESDFTIWLDRFLQERGFYLIN